MAPLVNFLEAVVTDPRAMETLVSDLVLLKLRLVGGSLGESKFTSGKALGTQSCPRLPLASYVI